MDTTVFDVFELTPYKFLQIARGGIVGNDVESTVDAYGVFKLRSDLVRGENAETKESNATLHVRPTESFLAANENNLVGHGIDCGGKTYEIVGQTGGMNFHTGVMEHYTVTLQESEFPDYEES